MGNITLIAAAGEKNEIGIDNELLWHLPDDFKRFKEITIGHKIIMGRKTFESFPKPLPKRTHIVITRDLNYKIPHEDCTVVHSLQEALDLYKNEDVFVIGGGEIYTQALPFSNFIELTRVHGTFKADTFFPEVHDEEWELIKKEYHPKDVNHNYDFTYLTYARKN